MYHVPLKLRRIFYESITRKLCNHRMLLLHERLQQGMPKALAVLCQLLRLKSAKLATGEWMNTFPFFHPYPLFSACGIKIRKYIYGPQCCFNLLKQFRRLLNYKISQKVTNELEKWFSHNVLRHFSDRLFDLFRRKIIFSLVFFSWRMSR